MNLAWKRSSYWSLSLSLSLSNTTLSILTSNCQAEHSSVYLCVCVCRIISIQTEFTDLSKTKNNIIFIQDETTTGKKKSGTNKFYFIFLFIRNEKKKNVYIPNHIYMWKERKIHYYTIHNTQYTYYARQILYIKCMCIVVVYVYVSTQRQVGLKLNYWACASIVHHSLTFGMHGGVAAAEKKSLLPPFVFVLSLPFYQFWLTQAHEPMQLCVCVCVIH